jgi:mRNA-degrading endonuclease RelE of RelBE toxin-antitoxin system
MKPYTVLISKTAQKEICRLDKTTVKKVDKALLQFEKNPFLSKTEKLVNYPEADYRHRIGNWRILFDLLPGNIIHILHIWHRGKDYKK